MSRYGFDLNVVTVNSVAMPGRSTIQGAALKYNYEKRPGAYRSGATIVFRGLDLCEPTLKIDMWQDEHFLQWEFVKKLFDPPKPSSPLSALALGIAHPLLADLGLANFVVTERGAVERADNGLWTVLIKLLEYRPPLPAIVKTKGSVPASGGAAVAAATEADKALVEGRAAFAAAQSAANGAP